MRFSKLTLTTIIRIHIALCKNNWMWYTSIGIDTQTRENIIENLLLILVMCDNVLIELKRIMLHLN